MDKPILPLPFLTRTRPLLGALVALSIQAPAQADAAQATPRRVAAPAPPAGAMYLYPERIPLEAGGLTLAERGVLFVPVNRNQASSPVISLEVYRFPATDPQPGVPPIFLLYGGPNFGGLEPLLARKGFYEKRLRALHQTADLVVVSQRGIGPSKPTTWIEIQSPFPLDRPVSEPERIEGVQAAARREKAFWIDQGLDLGGFTVLEGARP